MGNCLEMLSDSSTPRGIEENQLLERRQSQSESRQSATFPAPSSDGVQKGRKSFTWSQRASQRSNDRYSLVSEGTACNPKLECFIIPSFGKEPPTNVAVKKASSDFLKGVGDDLKIIQGLIGKDYQKELGNVTLMCHFVQEKVANSRELLKTE